MRPQSQQDRERWSLAQLQTQVDPAIFVAPGLSWEKMDNRVLRHLLRSVSHTPWLNPLTLLAGVLTSYAQLDHGSIRQYLSTIYARLNALSDNYGFSSLDQWDPSEHITHYMQDLSLPDSLGTRQAFFRNYIAAAHYSQSYLRSLPDQERAMYQRWTLPALPDDLQRQHSQQPEVLEAQQQKRKQETDALAPHYAALRAEAHLRWNELHRLRLKFHESIRLVQTGKVRMPFAFSYEEPRRHQRLHFLLWDTPSFIENHPELAQTEASKRAGSKRSLYFIEWVQTEPLGIAPPPGEAADLLWFGDLLRYELIKHHPLRIETDFGRRQLEYLRSWGYITENRAAISSPFTSQISGLLNWPRAEWGWMRSVQECTRGLIIPVEPLYAAATFGLAALDVFTTTGARMGELLQISLTPDCLQTLLVNGSRRLILRLMPKGAKKVDDYFVGPETQRNFEKVAALLTEHYQLKGDQSLPAIPFNTHEGRSHQFPARPYLFQFSGQHLSGEVIIACLRFLCHGIIFQMADGQAVKLKAHALRHVFATHLHQVEHVPLDVVATLLHQKNLQVTGYYAAPTQQQIIQTTDTLLDRFATHLGSLEEAIIRAPETLRNQLLEAQQQVGTLTRVPGGVCTCHAICPIAFACTGCVYKVPDPERRQDVVEQKRWAAVWLKRSEARQLGPEIVKMRALIQRCDTELEEMRLIEGYQKDEQHEPPLHIDLDA